MKISAQKLILTIERKTILDSISFTVVENSLTALIGKNGSGKTTLLQSLCRLHPPASGEIMLNGKNLSQFSKREFAQTLTWLPYSNHIPFAFSCLEVVVLGRYVHHQGFPQKRDFQIAEKTMHDLGISDFTTRSILTLSAGERQRVLIARALAAETPILLLDEPCAHLDLHVAMDLLRYLEILTKQGRTIVFSIHDIHLVQKFASHFLAICDPNTIVAGSSNEFNPTVVKKSLSVDIGSLV